MDTLNSTEKNTNSKEADSSPKNTKDGKKSFFLFAWFHLIFVKHKKKVCKTIIITSWFFFLLGCTTIGLYIKAVNGNWGGNFGTLPSLKILENPKSQYSSEIYSTDTVLLGKYYRSNRTPISFEEISDTVKNALLATEDIRFYEHSGIDMTGTFSIAWYLLKGDNRGASTITQQLAKNLYNTRSKELKGDWGDISMLGKAIDKTKEWITAIELEKRYTKQEIMTMYLNTVDFGSNSFGIKVAAKTFFGKDQKDLRVEEAAMLIGLLKAPSQFSPIMNPKSALERRKVVVSQMNKYKFIPDNRAQLLKADTSLHLTYNVENHTQGSATYFRAKASNFLRKWCKANNYDLYEDGLKIYTTIDSRFQIKAEEAVQEHMAYLQKQFFEHWKDKKPWVRQGAYSGVYHEMKGFIYKAFKDKKLPVFQKFNKKYNGDSLKIIEALKNNKHDMLVYSATQGDTLIKNMSSWDSLEYYYHILHTGFLSMDPKSGHIKAWVGGVNFKYFKYDHVKQGKRQPGSTFKPLVYATILSEASYSPCYKVVDLPVTFLSGPENNQKAWTPKNADGKYSGDTLTIRQAMARSINSITAAMMKKLGPNTPNMVVKYARRLGIKSHLEAVPAICLGTFDVSVYEMVGAYSAFANDGMWIEPHFITKIEDRYGNIIKEFHPEKSKAMNKENAHVMLHMLQGATQEKGGTALGLYGYKGLMYGNEVGAKTGTTQNASDGWFMGVTPQLVSGCWVGADHRSIHFRDMKLGQGAKMALPIWAKYMQKVYADTSLGIVRQKFKSPKFDLPVELDCEEYEQPSEDNNKDEGTLKFNPIQNNDRDE